jgi:hypothetical protein
MTVEGILLVLLMVTVVSLLHDRDNAARRRMIQRPEPDTLPPDALPGADLPDIQRAGEEPV